MYMSPTTVDLAWNLPPNDGETPQVTNYLLALTPDGQSTTEHIIEYPIFYYEINTLVHGVSIQATLKASNDSGATYGPEFVFPLIVPILPPTSPPTVPSAVADGPGIATISWQPPETLPEGAGYYLIMSVSSNPSDISIGYTTNDMTELSCTITTLNPQSEYYFTIEIVNQIGRTSTVSTNTIVFPPASAAEEPTQ